MTPLKIIFAGAGEFGRPALEALTSALLERETLNRDDVRQIVDRARPQTTAA